MPQEMFERATGATLSVEPYLDYLRGKAAAVYGIDDVVPEPRVAPIWGTTAELCRWRRGW